MPLDTVEPPGFRPTQGPDALRVGGSSVAPTRTSTSRTHVEPVDRGGSGGETRSMGAGWLIIGRTPLIHVDRPHDERRAGGQFRRGSAQPGKARGAIPSGPPPSTCDGLSSAPLQQASHPGSHGLHTSREIYGHAMGDEVPGVVVHERPPALGHRAVAWQVIEGRWQVLADGAWRDPQSQLQL